MLSGGGVRAVGEDWGEGLRWSERKGRVNGGERRGRKAWLGDDIGGSDEDLNGMGWPCRDHFKIL